LPQRTRQALTEEGAHLQGAGTLFCVQGGWRGAGTRPAVPQDPAVTTSAVGPQPTKPRLARSQTSLATVLRPMGHCTARQTEPDWRPIMRHLLYRLLFLVLRDIGVGG
jgi:hypothetical protein